MSDRPPPDLAVAILVRIMTQGDASVCDRKKGGFFLGLDYSTVDLDADEAAYLLDLQESAR